MSPWLNVASFRKRGCLDPFLHFWPLICTKNLSIFVNKQIIYSVYLGQNIYLSLNYYIWYFLYSRNKLTSWSIWPGNENDILLRVLRNLLSDSRRNRFNLNLLMLKKMKSTFCWSFAEFWKVISRFVLVKFSNHQLRK